ncbi:MAG: hypothetical protein F4Y39_02475 [Gemmatimonadetes bacterium]|nr:hypothetical protein [Gemmatimonadota bacterium]MYF72305.1 hypothetical protein [Gemmatimonadota bacterium]MYK22697.1 hypothetical protein [Candidatus Poribacteria bacterium]
MNGIMGIIIGIVVTIGVAWGFYYLQGKRDKELANTKEIMGLLVEVKNNVRLGLAIVIVTIGLGFTLLLIHDGDKNSVQSPIENNKVEVSAIPDSIQKKEKEKDFFHYKDRGLAERLSDELSDTQAQGNDESMEQRTNRLNRVIEDNPLIADLRDRARQYKPPFQYIGTPVQVGIPSGNRPQSRTVYVAFESEFAGRVVEIRNPKNEKHLTLRAIGAFHHTTSVDFQMNRRQAIYLFGRVNTTAKAVAFILPPSTQPKGISEHQSFAPLDEPKSQ